MSKYLLTTLLCFMPFLIVSAQSKHPSLTVSIDVESATAICNLIAGKNADSNTLNKTATLYGNTLLIQKVKGYSGAGEDVFKRTLKEIIETGTIKGDDPYNWKYVKERLTEIRSLLAYITKNKQAFTDSIIALISPFVPDTLHGNERACFLAGGGALGFTTGGDPSFNVALQNIGNDVEGLKYLVAHELYHTMQDIGQRSRNVVKDASVPYTNEAAYYLLYNVWCEGTATYVGDFMKVKEAAAFSKEQIAEYKKNADRRAENFRLFEALLYRQYNDSTTSYESNYNIAFTTAFDETSYFVGYEMTKQLIRYKENEAIAALLVADPLEFTEQYISLYQLHPEDKTLMHFSAPIESIIKNLSAWKGKL